ncbi:ATP-grasp domain-containing protein [Chelativorans sp. AA-79]|uniref:carboxylate--amine ligase n=1 Tax=Chelativorans sp. AA-79 TaxID=3028735 RepID=UPI0023F98CFA|nr:ATP-grasp domain-containing protein [Chelativorans sp. AA-79]WEX08848.1 ATP-grasp domain-containing protein [Chelativorans sp. AA-79]
MSEGTRMEGGAPRKQGPLSAHPRGVAILGGAHGTLALARSLGRRGVPVWLITNDNPLPSWSRHVHRTLRWQGAADPGSVPFLRAAAAEHGLEGFLLVPAADAEVRLVAQSVEALSAAYNIALPGWERLKWVCEKPLLYRRAAELGVDVPPTYEFSSVEEAARAEIRFPVVLKPNMGGGRDSFSRAKVARADDKDGFLAAYREAAGQIGLDNVVVQELIPGGGESQFSYAALWSEGRPVAEFAARRGRQYPVDFGYTSTFVEVVEEPRVLEAARHILGDIGYHGLVEVEFKHDARDDRMRVLDVNPRPWSWFGLAAAAGVDLGAMLWDVAEGRDVAAKAARRKVSWMYLVRDAAAGSRLVATRRLRAGDYFRSFATVRAWAAFSASDPMPGLIDIPLTAWRVLTRRFLKIH